jgi:uncharacterized membrane-anchored protein
MSDLANPKLMWLKGWLLLLIGLIAAILLILEHPTLHTAALLALCIWAFCRAYYFAFYVIHHYVDPSYRFSGLISFVQYAIRKKS